MSQLHRRQLLRGTLAAGAGAFLAPRVMSRPHSRPIGAGGDVRMGVVGLRSRGNGLMQEFHKLEGVRVVALCDVDSGVLGQRAAWIEEQGGRAATFADFREMLDEAEIDAVAIATPNHWHSLMTVWACQAGLDVYCEKPVSHNVWEGRKAVEAAKRYGRIVATGTQSRSAPRIRQAIQHIHEGKLGAVQVATGLCYKSRPSIGLSNGPQPIPDGIDYDLWCGPADLLPLRRARLHYDWHWVWSTGNGDIGNQGIHQMDVARWALGQTGLSRRVTSMGGRFGYVDDGQTPNTQVVVHDFEDGPPLIFEVRGLYADNENAETEGHRGIKIGNVIDCEGGQVRMDGSRAALYDPEGNHQMDFDGLGFEVGSHFQNFIDCLRSRKAEDLSSDIREGHVSSALCHLGNISHLLGRTVDGEALGASLEECILPAGPVERLLEHLAERGVDLAEYPPVAGLSLEVDPARERFIDQPMADMLLSRNYREPFAVPDEV